MKIVTYEKIIMENQVVHYQERIKAVMDRLTQAQQEARTVTVKAEKEVLAMNKDLEKEVNVQINFLNKSVAEHKLTISSLNT